VSTSLPYRRESAGLRLFLRVTPNAGVDRIEGVEVRDDGKAVLRLRVRAVPDKGKANAAVITLFAKVLDIPRSAIALVSGDTARLKTLRLNGDPAELIARVTPLLG
jgi:uncharacterized protein YggU (UPF0235/DUF167 family)